MNHNILSTSTCVILRECESSICEIFLKLLLQSITLPIQVFMRECMIDYLIEMACIYASSLLCINHVKFYEPVYYHVNHCKATRTLA